MGCLQVSTSLVSERLSVLGISVSEHLSVAAMNVSERLSVLGISVSEHLSATAMNVSERLSVLGTLVCDISDVAYIRVTPEVVWLTPSMLSNAEFEVQSNVDWRIE